MKKFLLTKIRLSWYFMFFIVFFFTLLTFLPRVKFESAALTLFSVNSFLYGFYIAPVLSAQKGRIDELHKIVRAEANALFSMALFTKRFPKALRSSLQEKFDEYAKNCAANHLQKAEATYEELITFCISYKGADKDQVDTLLEKVVANQQNRTNFALQVSNKVYSNEWMVMTVLFSITLCFILLIDTGSTLGIRFVTALLSTGISMLMVSLVKLNSLSHKKARQIWTPFNTLVKTRYYRIDEQTNETLA